MKVQLQYGQTGLDLNLDGLNATVLNPRFVDGLTNEATAFAQAVRDPINSRPLREIVQSHETVAVVLPDGTRPLPSDRLLPLLFAELSHVPKENFTILIGTGSHRANTPEELDQMLGADIARHYRVVNHDAHDHSTHALGGQSEKGYPIHFARDYVAADRRIILGFIEPHFIAGFSGGYKAVMPGLASIDSIMQYHGARVIGDPRSTWGELEGNPTQEHVRAGGSLIPIDFCINVTLNAHKQITRYFCGETMAAHVEGCAFSKSTAMVACEKPFAIVVASNSGYPLDQNLYQSVKGMCAASRIVTEGGLIAVAARCNDGFPEHGNFRSMLFESKSPQDLFDRIMEPGFSVFDQWQVQLLAMVQLKSRVGVHCELPDEELRRAHLLPIPDIRAAIGAELDKIGRDAPVAILPEGPLTIPYLV